MLTEAERVKLYELVYAFRDGRGGLTGIEQHVESLCAQARADALEEAATLCKQRAETHRERITPGYTPSENLRWALASVSATEAAACASAISAQKDSAT